MALRELLAKFDVQIDTGKLDQGKAAVDGLAGKLKDTIGLLGAGALVAGFRGIASEVIDLGGSLTDTSAKLGVGTGDLQRWQFAAGQTGVSAEGMNAALTKFTRTIGEATSGNGGAVDAFKALGVAVTDSGGNVRSSTDLMLGAAQGLSEISDPAARAKAAIDLFGKSGADLIPLLGQGEEGVAALLKEADALGGVLDEKTIAALDDAGDASDKFDFAMRGLKAQLVLAILPTLQAAGEKVIGFVSALNEGGQASEHMKSVLVVLGAVALATGIRAALPWIGWAIVIAGLVLLVDDLWTGLKGGDSVTGRFLDRVFGKGAGKAIFASIREDVSALSDRLSSLDGIGAKVEEVFATLGATLVQFFVSDLPEAIGIALDRVADGTAGTGEKAIGGIRDAFVGLGPTLVSAAEDAAAKFISGLVNGIKDGTALVTGAVKDMASGAVGALSDTFKFGSPSRLTRQFGAWTGEGMAQGITASAPGVAGAARSLAQGTARALLPPAGGPRTFNQTNHVQVRTNGTGAAAARSGILGGLGDVGRSALDALTTGAV